MTNPREPFESDTIYHVYNHGNGDDLIFREDDNYRFFLERFKVYITPIADIYAYCLMPNHFHFLLRVKPEEELIEYFKEKYPSEDLSGFQKPDRSGLRLNSQNQDLTGFGNLSGLISRQFSNFSNSYSKAFNKMYDRKGKLFKSSVERKSVKNDDYFTTMIRYIHFNPVLHEFTDNLFQWKYTSIHSFYSEKRSLIKTKEVIDWFGGTEPFKKFHQSIQEEEFDEIKHLTIK